MFIGSHSHTVGTSTNQYAKVCFTFLYRKGNRVCIIRVIGRIGGVCSMIFYRYTLVGKVGDNFFFEFKSGVIAANGYFVREMRMRGLPIGN